MKCIFLSDHVNKKKGDVCKLNGAVAGDLIRRGIVKKSDEHPKSEKGAKVANPNPKVEVKEPEKIVVKQRGRGKSNR